MFRKLRLVSLVLLASCIANARQSSPGNVTFSAPNAVNTNATFDTPGTFILQLSASDGVLVTTKTVTVVVNSAAVMPVLTVGSSGVVAGNTLTIPINLAVGTTGIAGVQFDIVLQSGAIVPVVTAGAAAIAAGKIASSAMVGLNERVIISGTNQTIIGAGQIAILTIPVPVSTPAGTQTLSLTGVVATDPNAVAVTMGPSVSGTITITAAIVNKAPILTVSPATQTITLPAGAVITGSVSDDGLPNPPGTVTLLWSVL